MIRVAIVDDDALVRGGLRTILSSADDIEVVDEADDGARAVELVRRAAPDVVVMDIRMPVLDGIEATRLVTAEPDAPRVLVLTTFHLDKHVFAAIEAGASGSCSRTPRHENSSMRCGWSRRVTPCSVPRTPGP